MKNFLLYTALALTLTFCKKAEQKSEPKVQAVVDPIEKLAESVLESRRKFKLTDILSRELPQITREQAFDIQLRMLEKELASGKKLIGYKMGGTAVPDSASYDPIFGYMLNTNVIQEDSTVMAENFPGGDVAVEGEIGFMIKKDFKNGVDSMDDLVAGIEYVFNAVEFAKAVPIPIDGNEETMNINHIAAAGTGHAGIILGSGRSSVQEFDFDNESVSCLINGESKAEGVSSNVYGNPMNALYSLVNLLPQHGTYLKKGEVVITGSLYKNPIINSTCDVKLKFATLGEINFSMK